jgi:hypothetical protein
MFKMVACKPGYEEFEINRIMKTLNEILEQPISYDHVLIDVESIPMLVEQDDTKNQRHLDHAEDLAIRGNGESFNDMISSLLMTHEYLAGGRKRPNYSLSAKMDGSPSVVWGYDPNNGKFFVGTKSTFNKNPKVNYNDKDIDGNHGHQKGLPDRLKLLLQQLKKVTPRGKVFQGDLMYTSNEVADGMDGHLSFTPNTLTYHVPKDSPEGKKILKSKVGVAPHTEYEKTENGDLQAKFGVDLSQFKKHDDIHLMDTKISGPFKYSRTEKEKFTSHIERAKELQKKLTENESASVLKNHEKLLLAYINQSAKTKKEHSVEGYLAFLQRQMGKRMDDVKLDKDKGGIRKAVTDEMAIVSTNKHIFNNLFQLHKQIQSAKSVLVNVLSQQSPYKESMLGTPSKPEGYVVSHNGKPMKLADRQRSSASDWNERANPEHNPTVMHWDRAETKQTTSSKENKKTSSKDKKDNNPLTPADKVKWLKTMFPGQEVSLAGRENHTIIAQLQQLHNKGVKHVTIVAGAERVPEYTKILTRYNGPGRLFHFHKARVVSSGERDRDSKGNEKGSDTKARNTTKNNGR